MAVATDPTGLSGPLARLLGVEKALGSTQRGSELAQDQLAGESVDALHRRSPNQANGVSREKIGKDRERRRKEQQRRRRAGSDDKAALDDTFSGIDFTA
ncbi:MAG: hypothetical protein QHI38_09265 [Armatimonadota bacterium]|nr:hypothetical protein [Armatimonadota bacterium]